MKVFDTSRGNAIEGRGISYKRPLQIGEYSRTHDGSIHLDDRCLKSYQKAPLHTSLLVGLESHQEPPHDDVENPAPMDPIFECLTQKGTPKHDVVSYRNNLNKILQTPYNDSNEWCIEVRREEDRLILNCQLTESQKSGKNAPSEYVEKCCYAGRYYEVLSTNPAADTKEEYCGVFRCELGSLTLILAAEIDCANEEKEYVELKTFRELKNPKDVRVFERHKLLSFWIQSYLVGVPYVRVGFRGSKDGEDFVLKTQQLFRVLELPKFGGKYWKPEVCLNFAHGFLKWLLDNTESGVSYLATYIPTRREVQLIPKQLSFKKRKS